ncbi:MAG: hypothetical protein KBH41_15250 [Azonexus sp.]|nr:hypothetical protein [Azonexus sp.]
MKLITERIRVREVAAKWAETYPTNGLGRDEKIHAITEALSALDTETATAADVAAIIGNNTWCGPVSCDECGAVVDDAVMVGEELYTDSITVTLCFSCVEKAMELTGFNSKFTGPL